MEHLILKLRKALVHYEECYDVNAAEHIIGESLMHLIKCCDDVKGMANDMIKALVED